MLGLEGPGECWAPAALRLLHGAKGLRLRKTGVILREYSGCGSSAAVSCGPRKVALGPSEKQRSSPHLPETCFPGQEPSGNPWQLPVPSVTGYGISN